MADAGRLHPEWEGVPYQVKRTSVREACRAMSNLKEANKELSEAKAKGERMEEDFSELHFRSRKNPKQSCYIPDDAVSDNGIYPTILGHLRMAEAIPEYPKESRLVRERGLYWLAVPHPAQCGIETPSGDGAVALDPGVRTFLTFFSETECGKIGYRAFGRIQRLCTGWTTSSAGLPPSRITTDVGGCAGRRDGCGRESSTWWTSSTGRPPAGSPATIS